MGYQVLARKWRPRAFTEMVGQEHVLRALINGLDNDRLHHAYLFTGTRGVGKTTLARILAKCLNCEEGVSSTPCNQCASCREIAEGRFVDLIEVDAASRTKVEDTRELLDNVQYAPTRGRYKVYLIDEVHMLSSHSFNALLKTLEEPPPHVKFLLATTDPQKLPVTVLSRCLQFNLKNLSAERIVGHLKHVLTEEKVPFEESALWQLGRAAEGSMRDALSLTDQAIAHGGGTLTAAEVNAMLGTIDQSSVAQICCAVAAGDVEQVMGLVEQMAEHAPDYGAALADMLSLWHQVAIAQAVPDALDPMQEYHETVTGLAARVSREDIQLFYQMTLLGRKDLPYAADPRSGFEMVLLRLIAFRPVTPDQVFEPPAGGRLSAGGEAPAADNAPLAKKEPAAKKVTAASKKSVAVEARQFSGQTDEAQRIEGAPLTEGASPTERAAPPQASAAPQPSAAAMPRAAAAEPPSLPANAPDRATAASPPVAEVAAPAKKPESLVSAEPKRPVDESLSPSPDGKHRSEQSFTGIEPKQRSNVTPLKPSPPRPVKHSLDEGAAESPDTLDDYESYLALNQPEQAAPAIGNGQGPGTTGGGDERTDAGFAAASAIAPGERIPFSRFSPDTWTTVCESLGQGGLLHNTAINLVLEAVDDNHVRFLLDSENSGLYDESQQQRLGEVLSNYFQYEVHVAIRVGAVDRETPRMTAERLRMERMRRAIESLRADPNVQEMGRIFGAELVESSVTPIDR